MAREILLPKTSSANVVQQDIRDSTAQAVDKLYTVLPGNSLVEKYTASNGINLLTGSYPTFVPTKVDTSVHGIAGSTLAGATISTAGCYVNNVRFTGAVTISATARVLFNNCRFDTQVTVASGGQVNFSNCYFSNSNCNNAGAVGDVGVFGGRRTGSVHTNCTIFLELS